MNAEDAEKMTFSRDTQIDGIGSKSDIRESHPLSPILLCVLCGLGVLCGNRV